MPLDFEHDFGEEGASNRRFEATEEPESGRKTPEWTESPSDAGFWPWFWAPKGLLRSVRSPATAFPHQALGHPSPIGQNPAPKSDRLLA